MDFISRVNIKDVNKLQLEGLTKSGAFDEFDADRSKLLNSIPKIIQKIKIINEDKINNQTSLFDEKNVEDEFKLTKSNKWSKKELLSEEFRSLGFYISDHPLNDYGEVFDQLNIISYRDFFENNNGEALIAGTIMSVQEKKAQKALHLLLLNLVINRESSNFFILRNFNRK